MRRLLLFVGIIFFVGSMSYAQKDTVHVLGYYESGNQYGTLNTAIDDAIAAGTISNTVFKLTSYEVYVLDKSIYLDHGQDLEIVADPPLRAGDGTPDDVQKSAPPQIMWTEETITRSYLIQSYADISMKNVWVRFADFLGNHVSCGIFFENQDASEDPERGTFDGCLFDYDGIGAESGGCITVKGDHFVGRFTNCYWRNNTDNHYRYYGRAVSFPYESSGWHYDSLFFENCTFANLSRVVMCEGNEFGSNIQLNHCTILNTVEPVLDYNGWNKNISVTNSIIINPFMYGYQAKGQCNASQTYDDFLNGLCTPPAGGMIRVTAVDSFGFSDFVDFADSDRSIFVGNDAYMYAQYMLDWYTQCEWCVQQHQSRNDLNLFNPAPMVGEDAMAAWFDSTDGGSKVFPRMNIDTATVYDADPDFIEPATNQDTMLIFMDYKWGPASDIDWSYKPYWSYKQIWPLPEDMAYNNTQYQTAAMGGFPLGDLNWYPDQMAAWEAQRDAEWTTINNWLQYGTPIVGAVNEKPGSIPKGYVLKQNYPNPFNPTTNIEYSVPKYSYVTLKVYNTLGQEVATLFNGEQKAGNYVATFDGKGLASGVYMYRLESNGISISKKFVLMK